MTRSSLLDLARAAAALCLEEGMDPGPEDDAYADYLYRTFLLSWSAQELEAVRRGEPTKVVGLPVCLLEAVRRQSNSS
jgi:hypothetical protein